MFFMRWAGEQTARGFVSFFVFCLMRRFSPLLCTEQALNENWADAKRVNGADGFKVIKRGRLTRTRIGNRQVGMIEYEWICEPLPRNLDA